jgi:hypothetical protein
MNPLNLSLPDLVGSFVGFGLTLLVFSYLFGDNALFRLVIHLFIGVASGYAAVVAWYNVVWPQLLLPLITGSQIERLLLIIPLALAVLLLFKASPRFSRLGNPSIAVLLGAGAATAIGGAVLGTILPQANAAINLFDLDTITQAASNLWVALVKGSVILIGTLTTLIYFHFGVRPRPGQQASRPEWVEFLSWVGQIFIAITLGMLFAGVYTAALTALVERIHFIGDIFLPLLFP